MKSRQNLMPIGAGCEISMEDASADGRGHSDDHEQNHAAPEGTVHQSTCVVLPHDTSAPPKGWRVSGDRVRAKRATRVRCTRGLGPLQFFTHDTPQRDLQRFIVALDVFAQREVD